MQIHTSGLVLAALRRAPMNTCGRHVDSMPNLLGADRREGD